MALWTPPISRELRDSTSEYTASVESMVARLKGVMDDFNRELKQVDPYLELIFAPPNADAPGLKPGRYHVMRHNPGAPPSLHPIVGTNGEFVEPTLSAILDWLARNDLQRAGALDEVNKRKERAQQAAERAKAREAEERQDELAERWAAVSRAQVSMNTDSPWSQNAAGKRGRKKAA